MTNVRLQRDAELLTLSTSQWSSIRANVANTHGYFQLIMKCSLCLGHDKPVSSVSWSLNRQCWLSASHDQTLRLWTHDIPEPAVIMVKCLIPIQNTDTCSLQCHHPDFGLTTHMPLVLNAKKASCADNSSFTIKELQDMNGNPTPFFFFVEKTLSTIFMEKIDGTKDEEKNKQKKRPGVLEYAFFCS